jgi:beta-lactamase regulating signal transducer with metallopeptidase domain
METLMLYLVKANVIFTLLFLAFVFLFKNERAFYVNRFFLLSTVMFSLLLPLVPAINYNHASAFPNYVTDVNPLKNVFAGEAAGWYKAAPPRAVAGGEGFVSSLVAHITLIQLLAGIYLLVALVLFNKFIYQLLNLFFLFKSNKTYKGEMVVYCEHSKALSPFSFFNVLFINPAGDYQQLEQIMEHEHMHIRQRHSIDVLLMELFGIALWINPLCVYLKRYGRLNLEYIADDAVVNSGVDKKQYQLNILHSSINQKAYPLTNLFSSSKIKHRIKMINQSKPSGKLYKYLFVLPIVLISYLLINPNAANSSGIHISAADEMPIKAFEGIYQDGGHKTAYFKVTAVNNTLVARRLDFEQTFIFTRTGDFTFEGKGTEPNEVIKVTFTKNDAGEVSGAHVDNNAPWVKVAAYKPIVNVTLTAAGLKAFEGKYQFEQKPEAFLVITATATGLTLKQLWDGKEVDNFVPTSDHEFLNVQSEFPLRFVKDSNGKVVKMYAFSKDAWDLVK